MHLPLLAKQINTKSSLDIRRFSDHASSTNLSCLCKMTTLNVYDLEELDKENINSINSIPKTPTHVKRQPLSTPQDKKHSKRNPVTKSDEIPRAPAKFSSIANEKMKRALAPLSILSMLNEDNISHETKALNTKQAWTAITPKEEIKRGNKGRSLPVLNGSNVTVDSPDPTSKFHARRSSGVYIDQHDSPDVEAHGNTRANDPFFSPDMIEKRSNRRESLQNALTEQIFPVNNGSELPLVVGSNVSVDSPDPYSKFNNNNNRPPYSHSSTSSSRLSKLNNDSIANKIIKNVSNTINKSDIFTKTFSPFKPDYEEICREVRSPLVDVITTPVSSREQTPIANEIFSGQEFSSPPGKVGSEITPPATPTGGPEFCSPQGLLDVQGFENDEEFQDIPDSLPLFSKTYRKTSFNNEYSDDNDNISDDSKIIFELENKYDMESISIIRDLRKKKSEKSSLKNDYEDNRIKIKTETDSSINKNKMDTDMYTTSMISNKKDFLTQTLRGNSSSSSPISSLPSRPHVEKLKPVMPSHNPFASKSQGQKNNFVPTTFIKQGRTYRDRSVEKPFTLESPLDSSTSMISSKIWSKSNISDEKSIIDIANLQKIEKIDQISNIVKKEKKNKKDVIFQTEMTEIRSPASFKSSPRIDDVDETERIYRPRKIRISKVSVSIPIGRNKSSRRKRRSISSFISHGPILSSIPENEELYNFDSNF